MDKQIIVFSGMPASGKDTITGRLNQINPGIVYFKKYRAIGPKDKLKDTYFNVSVEEFEKMIEQEAFIQYHGRYSRYYGIAKSTLIELLNEDIVPIIHIGRIENYYTFIKNLKEFEKQNNLEINVIHIQLWEEKNELERRIKKRDVNEEEVQKRICAMEQEFYDAKEMMQKQKKPFSIIIKNEDIELTCKIILECIDGSVSDDGYEEFNKYLRSI